MKVQERKCKMGDKTVFIYCDDIGISERFTYTNIVAVNRTI